MPRRHITLKYRTFAGRRTMKFSLSDRSPSVCLENLVYCTFQALARVPDFRKARGRRLDLSGVLAPIVVGLASGHHTFAAIAAFGKRKEEDLIPMLGLPRAPSHKTGWRIANGVSPEAIREVLREIGGEATSDLFDMAIAIDGKCMRGSRTGAGDQADVVMAAEHSTRIVLDAVDVPPGGCEKTAGRAMVRGPAKCPSIAIITGDALYADRPTARAVVGAGKNGVLKLKGATNPASTRT
jgi:hypothetical protein